KLYQDGGAGGKFELGNSGPSLSDINLRHFRALPCDDLVAGQPLAEKHLFELAAADGKVLEVVVGVGRDGSVDQDLQTVALLADEASLVDIELLIRRPDEHSVLFQDAHQVRHDGMQIPAVLALGRFWPRAGIEQVDAL